MTPGLWARRVSAATWRSRRVAFGQAARPGKDCRRSNPVSRHDRSSANSDGSVFARELLCRTMPATRAQVWPRSTKMPIAANPTSARALESSVRRSPSREAASLLSRWVTGAVLRGAQGSVCTGTRRYDPRHLRRALRGPRIRRPCCTQKRRQQRRWRHVSATAMAFIRFALERENLHLLPRAAL